MRPRAASLLAWPRSSWPRSAPKEASVSGTSCSLPAAAVAVHAQGAQRSHVTGGWLPHRPRHPICPRFALNSSKGKPAGEVLLNGRLDSMTETLRRHYNNPVPHVRGGGSVTTCTTHVSSRKRYATPLPIVHTAVGHHPPRIQHQGLDHVPPAAPVSLHAPRLHAHPRRRFTCGCPCEQVCARTAGRRDAGVDTSQQQRDRAQLGRRGAAVPS